MIDYSGTGTVAAIGILGIVTTFAMAYGFSHYDFSIAPPAGRHWLAVGCLVIGSVGLQVLRESALKDRTEGAEQKAKEAQENLTEKQRDLIKLLKSMPPAHALSTFTESYRYTLFQWRFRPTADESSPREEKDRAIQFLHKNIRFSLNAIAQLFLHYEHKPLDTKCSAHLAEYIQMKDIVGEPATETAEAIEGDPELEKRIRKRIRFVDDVRDPFRGLTGVLHVDPALSAYAEPRMSPGKAGEPDPKLTEEVFLPVPDCDDEQDDSIRSRALPIAPRAFRFGEAVYEDVQSQICREASYHWNVTQKVIDEVLEYMDGSEHGRIRSAAGYRLIWEVQSSEGEPDDPSKFPRLGVLTIFTESPARMDESGVSAYWDLVRPIIELQKEMLLTIVRLRS